MLPPTERTSVIQLVRLDLSYELLFSPERDDPANVVRHSLVLPRRLCLLRLTCVNWHVFLSCKYIHQLVYRDPFDSQL